LIKVSYRFWKVWQRNLDAFMKFVYVNLVGNLGDPILYLVAMGFGLGAFMGAIEGVPYVQFLAPGIIISSAMFAATYECTYESFLKMIHLHTYDAIIVTPVNIEDVVAGDVIWGATKAMLSGVMVFLVVAALGLVHSWWSLLIPILIFLVGFLFASLGMLMTAISPNFDYFNYFLELVITPLFFMSGIFFPLSKFPGWMKAAADISPLTHAVELSRALVLGYIPSRPLVNLVMIILPSIILFYGSIYRMKKRMIK
jgi:lipooligosaccharide transport system permease protein